MPDDLNALDVDKVALIPLVDYEKHYAEIPREEDGAAVHYQHF